MKKLLFVITLLFSIISFGQSFEVLEEQIKQNSMGFSQGLELLTNFDNADSKQMVFFYFREIK